MVESQSLAAAGGMGLAVGESDGSRRQQASPAGRFSLFLGIVLILTACVSGWLYFEASSLVRDCQTAFTSSAGETSSAAPQMLERLTRWRVVPPLLVGGLGLAMTMLPLMLLRRRDREWASRLNAETVEREATAARWRLLLSEKNTAEAHFTRQRQVMEDQLAELERKHQGALEELNRRKQSERTLSWEQRELARSKDVLELHVQARTQELQKLQRRYELILNSAGEGICGLDLEGIITFANPAAGRLTGWPIEELVGKPAADLFRSPAPEAMGAGMGVPGGGNPAFVRKDGSQFLAECESTPIQEGERPVGTVLIFKDVTSRKQAENALAEKAEELARSNAELEQFAFVASHDLQEPLRKILAFGDRLRAKCEGLQLNEGRDYLERMQNAAARMQRLIQDLLTFSRVISRSQPFALVDLGAVAREVIGDLELQLEKSHGVIEVGELPTVEGDAVQLRQLFQNLISNSLKFQPPGGAPKIRLKSRMVGLGSADGHTARLKRSPTGQAQSAAEEFAEISVEDNGIGFEEKYLDRIFVIFQRLHGRQEYEGTGIGLAVCRRIVDRHCGSITARSKPGEGATFVVSLPVRQPKNPQEAT